MEKKKMTYATALKNVLENEAITLDTETRERLNDLLESVNKKKRNAEGETAKAEENKALAEKVLEEMETGRAYTLAELVKELPMVAEYDVSHEKEMSTQKMATIVGALVDAGAVVKESVKRKNYYTKQ